MSIGRPVWMDHAACRGFDPDLWFEPLTLDQQIAVRSRCLTCPVQGECLDYALENGLDHGIWGGLDPAQRRHYRRQSAQKGVA